MPAEIIDGRAFAAGISARVAAGVRAAAADGLAPGLAVVLVGDDPASDVYVRAKGKATEAAGMASFEHRLGATTTEADLLALVARLNADPRVHAILVQLPLPAHIDERRVLLAVDPAKDVDGFHPMNVGLLSTGQPALVPCTPLGCLLMLRARLGSLAGADAVVVGRSNIVGKPMAQLLLGDSATVTVAHSRTRDLTAVCRRADILVAAVGRPGVIGADAVKPGATVIDVGITRVPAPDLGPGRTRLKGDVAPEVWDVAGAITPVPGGVGPVTIACLLANTLAAALRSRGLPVPRDLAA